MHRSHRYFVGWPEFYLGRPVNSRYVKTIVYDRIFCGSFHQIKTLRCQFHQHFARSFFVFTFQVLLAKEYWGKCAYEMLVKLTIAVFLRFQRKLAELTSIMENHQIN